MIQGGAFAFGNIPVAGIAITDIVFFSMRFMGVNYFVFTNIPNAKSIVITPGQDNYKSHRAD